MRSRRPTPRRRATPKWTPLEWDRATQTLLRRSGGRCECCGAELRGRAERSHRVRRAAGGDRLSNLLLVLPEHHARFHAGPEQAKANGFHLSQWADPLVEPVLWQGKRWVLLDDDGGMTPCDPPPTP